MCFGARDEQFGNFTMKQEGQLVAVRLVHNSGYLGSKSSVRAHWGDGRSISIAITDRNKVVIFPELLGSIPWFAIPGYSSTSKELIFNDPAFSKHVIAGSVAYHLVNIS